MLAGALATWSCADDDATCGGDPVITRISTAQDRATAINSGSWDAWIIIQGSNLCGVEGVKVNGVPITMSDAYATSEEITLRIPSRVTPTSSTLEVAVRGTTIQTEFSIIQPAPKITTFNPMTGNGGDVVTITGDFFDNLQSVKFDDAVAEIVSNTASEIKVKVPQGVSQAYLYVTTLGGTIKSASPFGFRYLVYDDALAANWWEGSWSGSADLNNTNIVKRGTKSIKHTYTAGFGGLKLGNGGATISLSGYTGIKLSIYGGPGTSGQVKIVVNGSYGDDVSKVVQLTEGAWTDFTIPLSELGSPTSLNEVVLQEFSGNGAVVIYVDDLGFI